MDPSESNGPRRKQITVITPVFNEEACVALFYERYVKAISPLVDQYDFKLLFINNASTDQTLPIIMQLRERDPNVFVVTHSRNFGYQASVVCGLTHAGGDAVIVIDADCEDPPEMIPDFVREWEKGYDIVYGERFSRPEFFLLQWTRKAFYRITRLVADWDVVLDMAEFAIFSSRVKDELLRNSSTFPYVRGELGYAGFRRIGITYRRQPRIAGETHYSFVRLFQFALAGILTASTFPLRLITYVGLPLMLLDVVAVILSSITSVEFPFVQLVMLHLFFMTGSFALISMYVARIYKDGMQRPLFIVDSMRTHLPLEWSDKGTHA